MTNLVTSPTCFIKTHKSKIDLILTTKENCFQKTKVTETGLSDFHKLISTFLRSHLADSSLKRFITEIIKHLMSKSFSKTLKIQTSVSIQTTQTRIMN